MFHEERTEEPLISRRLVAGLVYAAGDYVAILAAEFAAIFFRNFFFDYSTYHIAPAYLYFITPIVFMAFLLMNKLYTRKMLFYQLVERVFHACVYGVAFSVILMFFGRVSAQVSRGYVVLFAVFVFGLIVAVRYLMKKTVGKMSIMTTPVLIVGAGLTADAIVHEYRKDTGLNYKVIGFLEDNTPKTSYIKDYPILGGFADLEKVVEKTDVRTILIAAPGISQDELSDLIYRAQSIAPNVGIVPNLVGVPMSNIEAESYYDAKIMVIHIKNNLASRYNRIFKYTMGWILSIIGVIIISPLLTYLAFRIRKDSEGPVIYEGARIGRGGKCFKCYKFRSMYTNSDEILKKYLEEHPEKKEEWEVYHKLKGHDPRVTPIGEKLRATSLDELPQIFNVLKGDMGLVGPRPYLPSEFKDMGEYKDLILLARPGITGYWQTSGRNDVSFGERLHMESWYVCNWSIWMDIVLLWRTFKVVFDREGAY